MNLRMPNADLIRIFESLINQTIKVLKKDRLDRNDIGQVEHALEEARHPENIFLDKMIIVAREALTFERENFSSAQAIADFKNEQRVIQ